MADGLLQGEKYGFRVRAKNAGGVSIDGAELPKPIVIPVTAGKWFGYYIRLKDLPVRDNECCSVLSLKMYTSSIPNLMCNCLSC